MFSLHTQEVANPESGSVMTSSPADTEGAGFTHGFIASLSVIIVSELGDKTFFIAAIMAMTHSRLTVLIGALGALFLMTVLSGGLFYRFPLLFYHSLEQFYDFYYVFDVFVSDVLSC